MASQDIAKLLEQEAQPQQVPANPQPAVQDPQQMDYDFVEQPPQEFFCPVTLELLIDPFQTLCCGNHLSQEAANKLQRDGKPCPMCKEPQLATIPDKFFKRKVSDVKAHCPHKNSGCEWLGGVNEVKLHSDSCPKRPWHCQYCEFTSTYDIGPNEHTPKCTKYPVVCPNSCEVVSVPRCDLEAHLMVCPLQPVTCEYAEVGCDVKVPRRDLARHMEGSQQQHLLSATLLNLRMTRELKTQLKQVQESLTAKIANLQQQIVKYGKDTQEHLKQHDKHVECLMFGQLYKLKLQYIQQGYTLHEFTLTGFKNCQARGGDGDWYSEPFLSHPGKYKFVLKVATNGHSQPDIRGKYVSICFRHERGDDKVINIRAYVQLLNQRGDHDHHEMTSTGTWEKEERGCYHGHIDRFTALTDLELNAGKNTQYLKNDCLQFRIYFQASSTSGMCKTT